MPKNLLKSLFAGAFALTLLFPSHIFAQDEDSVADDSLYEYTTLEDVTDDAVLYNTTDDSTDYEWQTVSEEYNLTDEQAAAIGSFFVLLTGVGLVVFGVTMLVGYLYTSFALMVIADKVKEGPSWYAWVPFLNLYLMAKIAKVPAVSLLLVLIPVANLVYFAYVMMKIAERRGFPNWLGLLFLVPLVNLVLPGYLAWAEPSK